MRVGIGYDIHKLVKKRKLVLGGVVIPYSKGLKGYSDADVLIHAIIDAMIGAMGEADIGFFFPTSDPKYKGISSLKLLKEIKDILRMKGYEVVNIDSTIVAERPRLNPYVKEMRSNISTVLGVDTNKVNVKFKSPEGLGSVGKGQGIASYAVCLIEKVG